MAFTNFPQGATSFGIPVLPSGKIPGGNIFWVNSTVGGASDGNPGTDPNYPCATIKGALALCTANNDDIIYVEDSHVEAITTAGGLNLNVPGVTIIFMGNGSKRGTISFNATAATMLVSAANITMVSPRYLAGIDAVAAAINPQAADFQMYNAEYYDAPGMASTIQVLTTSAAARMVIDGYRYFASTTGTQKTDGIKLVGGDHAVIRNVQIEGNFTVAAFDNATTAATNLLVENGYFSNTSTTPQPAMVVQAASTGWVRNAKLAIYSGATYASSLGALIWDALCEGFTTLTGAATSLGTNGDMGIKAISKSVATAALTGSNVAWFTIAGGTIKVNALGLLVTTVMPATSNTIAPFFTPSGGSATAIGAATTDLNAAAVNQLVVLDGVKATAMVKTTDPGISIASALHMPIYLGPGVINVTYGGTPASGAATIFMDYEPMGEGITVS